MAGSPSSLFPEPLERDMGYG